jgi:hypothetical protein
VTVCGADTEPAETEPKSRVVTAGENTSTGTPRRCRCRAAPRHAASRRRC